MSKTNESTRITETKKFKNGWGYWWRTGRVELPDYIVERDIRRHYTRLRKSGNVLGLVGLRRTGKTTFLKLTLKRLDDLERACYFSFDLEGVSIRQLVEVFCERVLGEPISELEGEVHFLLDEVHNLENWSRHVKHFHDHYDNIQFTVTGSSTANILKGAGESLAGRFSTMRLRPFSFREYLRYHDIEPAETSLDSNEVPRNARKLRVKFDGYLKDGGMPELYRMENRRERLEEVIDLVFFRDVVELFDVGRSEILSGIFRILAQNTGQRVNFANICDSLNSDFRTVTTYVNYLEDSFLLSRSMPYRKSEMSRRRKNPKIYVADHSYADLYGAEKGLIAETVAFNHLSRIEKPQYMRDPEIDIVLPEKELMFEVKHTSEIKENTISRVAEKAKDERFKPFLVTEDVLDTREVSDAEVHLIPLWFLCLASS
ncbi:hypothetical protein AKJ37_04730 [candidate division MSBL1 archaeon SCGC-AAA259I09]|uniref:Uncharacterized protein n=1 Tax=candidate division MSBL1 archaeon SCGC-AAA259I09 TaxID=1698267 RepID=A0A133UR08_9EURY|nr:hypothetical protein AKJ37_04730 [candidate division MSBL1 archaeon SCGC-AAA259I09]